MKYVAWVTPGSETRNLRQGLLCLELTSLFPPPYSVFGRVTRANTDGGDDEDGDQQDRRRMQSASHHFVPASSGSTVMIRCQGSADVGWEESYIDIDIVI